MQAWLLVGIYLLFGTSKGGTVFSFLILIFLAGGLFLTPLAAIGLAWRERWRANKKAAVANEKA